MPEKVYINGNFVDKEAAKISVFDRGLNYGDGLFETIKCLCGRPLYFNEHMERLRHSARRLSIHSSFLDETTTPLDALQELLSINGLSKTHARIKIVLTRGALSATHRPEPSTNATIIITASALDTGTIEKMAKNGVTAIAVKTPVSAFAAHKTLNYLPNVMAVMEAEAAGAFEALLTGADGTVREGTSTNIFLVKNDHLKTPPQDGLILPGIMRNSLIVLANKLSYQVTEARVKIKELKDADEVFLSNSIIGPLALIAVSGEKIGAGSPGPVTCKLRRILTDIESDIKMK